MARHNKQTDNQAAKEPVSAPKSITKPSSAEIEHRQRQMLGAMFRPACKILVLIAIATLLLAVVTIWQYQASTRRNSSTTGVVTEVNKVSGVGKDADGTSAQKCRIGYKFTVGGNEYTDALGYRGDPSTSKCQLKPGQKVAINYDSNHPANNAFQVDDQNSNHGTFKQTASSAGSIAALGLIIMAVGAAGLHIANRHQRQAEADKRNRENKD